MLPVRVVQVSQVTRCFLRRFSASSHSFRSQVKGGRGKRFAKFHGQNDPHHFPVSNRNSLSALNPREGPPQFASSGNAKTDLDSFLATVNRRLENLLYTRVPPAL